MLNSAQYFGTWSYTDSYYYYSCSSSYSSLDSCSRSSAPSLCGSNDQVGLQCMTLPSTGTSFCMHNNIIVCIHKVCGKMYILISIKILVILQNAAIEVFDWLEDNHPMREDWNTVTMEHGLSFVLVIFTLKRL